ncbi:MAG: hypothetical protein WC810_03060 [Janthinobacterium sp.]|jgi:hypothetical protein
MKDMMTDMGKEMPKDLPMGGMKKEMMHPEMHIEDNIPECLANKDVGDECMMMMKVKVISKSEDTYGGKSHKRMGLKVMKMGEHKDNEKKEMKDDMKKDMDK